MAPRNEQAVDNDDSIQTRPQDRRDNDEPSRKLYEHLSMSMDDAPPEILPSTSADDMLDNALAQENSSTSDFLRQFASMSGPPQIMALCVLFTLALGSTVGVVPAVMTDRYARLNHGYDGVERCLDLPQSERPGECLSGNEDAQNAAAASSFVSNALTFVTSSLMGSISDERGRKGIMLLGIGLSLLGPLNLVLLQTFETMNPFLYFASGAASGLVSWTAVALSALSDVVPPAWRAPSFGLLLAGFSAGFALSPILAVPLSHYGVSIFALVILVGGFVFACVCLPETLPVETSRKARIKRMEETPAFETNMQALVRNVVRPAKELSILNRSKLFRLLSALAFFSGVVGAADQTLFLYYVEENFAFDDKDIAILFLIIGGMGILVQGILLKPLNARIGERLVIVVAFSIGAFHNFMYGVAKSKTTIFAAATVASFTGMSFPTISAIKSNNVDESEQGRIQGALYSLSSLASAIGPLSLRYVYHRTKDSDSYFGKGTMFVFGAGLYAVATVFAWMLPKDQANSSERLRYGRVGAEKRRSSLVEQEERRDWEIAYGAVNLSDA